MVQMTEIIISSDQSFWDNFANSCSSALFSHCVGYGESLAITYHLPLFRLMARHHDGKNEITGLLPLILFAAPNRVARLVSLPYTDAAGIVAADPDTGTRLLAAALQLAEKLDVPHVELRQVGIAPFHQAFDSLAVRWNHSRHTFKVGLHRPLPERVEELWALLSAKVRNQVRKARKSGCRVSVCGSEEISGFYGVFSENMRDLGSPVHSKALFDAFLAEKSLDTRVVLVHLAQEPVAAAMVFNHNGTTYNPWASSLRRFRSCCPNMLLYWGMLDHAVNSGCRWFDFGRSSPDAATCRFKRQWGAQMQPLTWHVFSRKTYDDWRPDAEGLVEKMWQDMELTRFRQQAPDHRRWISL